MFEHDPVNGKSFKKRLDFLVFVALMISATVFITGAALQRSKVEALESLSFLEAKEFGLPGYLIV
ncbi:MAG: peptidase M23, partial [Acetomicrobium sp.]|nr:peptidase M23 [Acetomicrobium sp.]